MPTLEEGYWLCHCPLAQKSFLTSPGGIRWPAWGLHLPSPLIKHRSLTLLCTCLLHQNHKPGPFILACAEPHMVPTTEEALEMAMNISCQRADVCMGHIFKSCLL
jgi:hypothetical protein